MKPLIFLTVRSFVNGIKRAVTSARRLIGLLVAAAYYFNFIFRPFSSNRPAAMPRSMTDIVEFRPEVLHGAIFLIFAVVSLFLMIGAFSPRGGFRAADVDVLFPTPINPKIVLYFRIVRDYLVTLLGPLVLAIIAGRSAAPAAFAWLKNFPEQGRLVTRLFSATYLLMTLCWVCIGYAISLFINRSDLQSDRNKKVIGWSMTLVVGAAFGYIALAVRDNPHWDTFQGFAHNPFLNVVFFTASAATAVIMAPFDKSLIEGLLGFGGMVAIIGVSLRMAVTQVGFMYDQAASRGFQGQEMRELQRSGDAVGVAAEMAKQGKVRGAFFAQRLNRWKVRGATALLWKELLLHARSGIGLYAAFGLMTIFLTLLPVWGSSQLKSESAGTTNAYLGFLAGGTFLFAMTNAQMGFIELLRRIDFQKPLPFSPIVTVFWEVSAKAFPSAVIAFATFLGLLVIEPAMWGTGLAGVLMAPSLALVLSATALIVMLIFPDYDDANQRGFRSLMMTLFMAIAVLPAGAAAVGMLVFHIHPLIVAIPFVGINLAVTAGVCAISGGLYASFNPSE